MSSAEFKDGGHTGRGNPRDKAGIVHFEEFVMPAHITRVPRNRRIFERILAGQDPLIAAMEASDGYWQRFGGSLNMKNPMMREFMTNVVATFGDHHGNSREIVNELKELRKENEGLRAELAKTNASLEKVAKRFSSKTAHEHHFGEMVLEGEKMKTAINRTRERELSL